MDEGGRRGLELTPVAGGTAVRACRAHPEPAATDRVQVSARVSVAGVPSSDITLASMRGSGGEAVSVRVTSRGTFAWFDGPTKVQTDVVARPGTDYGLSLAIDQTARTFDLRIVTVDGDVARRAFRHRLALARGAQPAQRVPGDGRRRYRSPRAHRAHQGARDPGSLTTAPHRGQASAMKIVVTGAAGFIGSTLAEALVEAGHEVVGLDAFIPYYPRPVKEANLAALPGARGFRFERARPADGRPDPGWTVPTRSSTRPPWPG